MLCEISLKIIAYLKKSKDLPLFYLESELSHKINRARCYIIAVRVDFLKKMWYNASSIIEIEVIERIRA